MTTTLTQVVKQFQQDWTGQLEPEAILTACRGVAYQTMAEDHARKSVGECHPYREFEGMQSSI